MRTLVQWGGALATAGAAELDQAQAYEALSYADYLSSIREMLRTDKEFQNRLDISDQRKHDVVGGLMIDDSGVPMVEVVSNGRDHSQSLAKEHPVYSAQAERDAADVALQEQIDALQPGQSLFLVSLPPTRALQKHRRTYEKLGYRDGLGFLHYYSKTEDDTVVAGVYSVGQSDEASWRRLFAGMGEPVPDEANDNTFVRHGFMREASPDQAEELAHNMRRDYYRSRGIIVERKSVSEYVAGNEETARDLFNRYYPDLAKAAASGENNDTMRDLAQSVLAARIRKLKPEVRARLTRVVERRDFDNEAAKTMDSLIRYAVVEELRKNLGDFVAGRQVQPRATGMVAARRSAGETNYIMSQNVAAGVDHDRGYGGCSSVELSTGDNVNGGRDPQMALGGRSFAKPWWGAEKKYKFDKKMFCVVCQEPPKKGEEMKECGPCGLCRTCDKKAGGQG
jgi:hypothetical protein